MGKADAVEISADKPTDARVTIAFLHRFLFIYAQAKGGLRVN